MDAHTSLRVDRLCHVCAYIHPTHGGVCLCVCMFVPVRLCVCLVCRARPRRACGLIRPSWPRAGAPWPPTDHVRLGGTWGSLCVPLQVYVCVCLYVYGWVGVVLRLTLDHIRGHVSATCGRGRADGDRGSL
jgi:hypothetical protein